MKVSCPSCQTNYNIDDKRIPAGGAKLKCAKCQNTFTVQPPGAEGAGAVPLPGGAPGSAAVPLPGGAPGSGAVPLPAGAAGGSKTMHFGSLDAPLDPPGNGAVPLPPGAPGSGAVPLPGGAFPPYGEDPSADAEATRVTSSGALQDILRQPEARGPNGPPPPDPFALADAPPPAPPSSGGSAFDLDSPAPPAPAKGGFDLDFAVDPPAPPPAGPPPLTPSNEAPPAPAAAAGKDSFGFSFEDLPAPAAPPPAPPRAEPATEPRSAAAAPPPDVSTDFGGVDLDTGGPEAAAPMEAPPPPPAKAAKPKPQLPSELDFVEEAPEGGGAQKFHVKRKSGKKLGPLDEDEIIALFGKRELIGSEEISTDGKHWDPIGSHPRFAAAAASAEQDEDGPKLDPKTAAEMERLKNLYEGRMAAVAMVDGARGAARLKRLLTAGGIVFAALAVLGSGAALNFTRYGAFGLKALFPAAVKPGTPAAQALATAREDLLADTYQSYREAKELTDQVLRTKEYPEVRAVWCQAVFTLSRRYAASSPVELARANAALDDIDLLGGKEPEVVKAVASADLSKSPPDPAEALKILVPAWGRGGVGQKDIQIGFLLAEAYAMNKQPQAAIDLLKRILAVRKDSAKALHALGNLYQAAGQADQAEQAYSDALKADPQHVNSAVELAAVELLVRQDTTKGLAAVEQALDDKVKSRLGPAEVARALALRGVGHLMQNQVPAAQPDLEAAYQLDRDSPFIEVNLAKVDVAQGQFDKALPLYRLAVAKEGAARDSQALDYTEGYLKTLIAVGNMSEALQAVTQANARFPGNAHIAYLFGRVHEALDHPAEAEAHYRRAVEGDPKLTEASLALARFYLRNRRTSDAADALALVQKSAPNDPAVHSALGELYLAQDKLSQARTEFQAAAAADPQQAEAQLGLSRVDYADGNLAAARDEVQKALSLNPHVVGGHLHAGMVLWKLNDLDGALKELITAQQEDVTNVKVAVVLGAVYLDKGDLAQAETNLVAALSADPSNPDANFYMARVKDRRALYTQAIDSMHEALERAPNRPDFHYEMGIIFRDAKQPADAIEEWKKTVQLDPKHADAFEALGQAYLDQSRFDDALGAFQNALKAEPGRARILGLMGDCYFQQAKWPQAVAQYQNALRADPTLKSAYYKIGRSYSEEAEHEKAITWYRKATQVDAQNAMPYYYLGYAYKDRNQKPQAIEAFQEYLKLKPNADDKSDIQDEIYDLQH